MKLPSAPEQSSAHIVTTTASPANSLTRAILHVRAIRSRLDRYHTAFFVLLAGALGVHLYALGHLYVAPWDEDFHAVVALHLAAHPLHPTLYDTAALHLPDATSWQGTIHTWLHIPPLGLWAAALSLRLLGATPFALRLPGVLFVAVGMLATFLLGPRLFGAGVAGRVAGLVGAAFVGYAPYLLLLSQGYVFGDSTDTPLVALTPLCVLALVQGARAATPRRRLGWLVLAGGLQGLCYLSKGGLGLAPTGVALALLVCAWRFPPQTGWYTLGIKGLAAFLGAAAAVAGPYNLYLAIVFPDTYRMEQQNWSKGFFSNYEGWARPVDYHLTGYLFTLYGVGLALLVMTAVITLAILAWRRRSRADLILVAWIVALYLPLSVAVTKAPPMTISAVSALGLAVGRFVVLGLSSRSSRRRVLTLGLLMGTATTSILILATQPKHLDMDPTATTPNVYYMADLSARLFPFLLEGVLALLFALCLSAITVLPRLRHQKPPAETMARAGNPTPTQMATPLRGERPLIAGIVAVTLAVLAFYWVGYDVRAVARTPDNPGPVPAVGVFLDHSLPANATVLLDKGVSREPNTRFMLMFWAHRDVYAITSLRTGTICPLVQEARAVQSPVVVITNHEYGGHPLGTVAGWSVYTPACTP